MPILESSLRSLLEDAFPDATLSITALVDDNDHFQVHIASSVFKGKNRVQQHQMVYGALKGKVGDELHALALKTTVKES